MIETNIELLADRTCMTASDAALEQVIARATSEPLTPIAARQSLSGGSIHRVERIELADGRCYCVKSNVNAGDMFAQEAYGLAAIAEVGQLRTPTVIAVEPLTLDSNNRQVRASSA